MSKRYDLLIKGGLLVDSHGVRPMDIGVKDGRILTVDTALSRDLADQVVDATGLHVIPGVIDPHVHLGIPMGWTDSTDDFYSGTTAAICGGVTTVMDFTVQQPGQDLLTSIRQRLNKAEQDGARCDYGIHANITSPTADTLDQIPAAVAMGVVSFKTFLAYPNNMVDLSTLSEIAALVKRAGGIVMVHAEKQEVIDRAVGEIREKKRFDDRYFFASRPVEAEIKAISDLGRISRALGAMFYIVHLSSVPGLKAAIRENRQGARLIVETCPQYLFLSVSPVMPDEPFLYVASPPLRSTADCAGLTDALHDRITTIGTDHCPFTRAQKARFHNDFTKIPGGLPGVETALPLMYHLAINGKLGLPRLVRLMSEHPARIFGLKDKGRLEPGYDADIVLLNPDGSTTITARNLHSRTDYTPYEGFKLNGSLEKVFLRGHLVAKKVPNHGMEPVSGVKGRFVPGITPLVPIEVPV